MYQDWCGLWIEAARAACTRIQEGFSKEVAANQRWNYSDYHGASLESLNALARLKGYSLVGCCLAGVNAFFVRDDLVQDRFAAPEVATLYNQPRYYIQRFLAAGHTPAPFGPYKT